MDPLVFGLGVIVTIVSAIPVVWQLRRHPRGLYVLFFAEMWERFSYYGMRGMLVFYLTQQFLFDDTFSNGKYGAYTSLVYLMPLIGGVLADRFLGTRKAVAFGALLLVAGHFTMAIEGKPATQILTYNGQTYTVLAEGRGDERHVKLKVGEGAYDVGASPDGGMAIKDLPPGAPLPNVLPDGQYTLTVVDRDPFYTGIFYLALALIIMGVGFLKPNISSIVGQLYGENDPRRDPGFTLYYYGINLGAFWASLLCTWLGQSYGWSYGFGLAGVGMLFGYVAFVMGKSWLEGKGEPPDLARLARSVLPGVSTETFIYLAALIGVGAVWYVIQDTRVFNFTLPIGSAGFPASLGLVQILMSVGSVAVLGYLLLYMLTQATMRETGRLTLALVLIAGAVVFTTLFEQAGSSMNLFAARNTQLTIGSLTFTAGQTQSFNAGMILLLAPIFSFIWATLGKRNLDPNAPSKFGLGLMQLGAGFFVLVWGAQYADASFKVPLIFLMVTYLLHTTGELCLQPVGLSQMTRLSPKALIATVMATWFLAAAWGQSFAAFIAAMTAAKTVGGQVLDPAAALKTSIDIFALIGGWGIVIGAGFLALGIVLALLSRGPKASEPVRTAAE
jgi:POT family proton-dependent oligopeptide transporter